MKRREFCVIAGAGLVALEAAGCDSGPELPKGMVAAGTPSALKLGSVVRYDNTPHKVLIARDQDGVYAMSADCQHSHCDVEWFADQTLFICPCHQSQYDVNGAVVQGPTVRPLHHLAVAVDEASGQLVVDTNTEVDASTRLAV